MDGHRKKKTEKKQPKSVVFTALINAEKLDEFMADLNLPVCGTDDALLMTSLYYPPIGLFVCCA